MGNKGTGRWAALLVASFMVHAALIVNSAETTLWNEQGREGALLAQQLADAAAPLSLSRDMVSLSVLVSRYENRPGVASVRLYNSRHELLAETGSPRDNGRLFAAPVQLQQQALGQVELRLDTPPRGYIVRQHMGNIALSALLHLLVFLGGLLLATRQQPATTTRRATPPTPAAEREAALSHPAPDVPASLPPPATSLLHIALDDPNSLLTRVNADMAGELLDLFDQFIDRAAQLYGGQVATPFSPEGVQVEFTQENKADREFQALAAAALFLQLVEDSAEERRQHGRLCLGAKAGVLQGDSDARTAAIIAHTAPAGRILSSQPQSSLTPRCHLGAGFQLALGEGETIQVAMLEEFAPEYRQLLHNQSQQILAPMETF